MGPAPPPTAPEAGLNLRLPELSGTEFSSFSNDTGK